MIKPCTNIFVALLLAGGLIACGKKSSDKKVENTIQSSEAERVLCLNPQKGQQTGVVDYPKLKENSGIDFSGNIFWALNDQGAPELFAIGIDGTNYGRFEVKVSDKIDWEDIAVAPCLHSLEKECIYIADTGDNEHNRPDYQVHAVESPADFKTGVTLNVARTYTFKTAGPQNLEAFAVNVARREFYFISKNESSSPDVFVLPEGSSEAVILAIIDFDELKVSTSKKDRIVTGADFDEASQTLLIGTNDDAFEIKLDDLSDFKHKASKIKVPALTQSEAIAYHRLEGKLGIVVTSEGKDQPLYRISCE